MIVDKVKKTIRDHAMIDQNEAVLLCVSGGIDSMALLDIFISIKDNLDLSLSVCHLNHNLRGGESERDLRFVEEAAKERRLEFYTKTLAEGELTGSGGSLQERAREARYAFFTEAAQKLGATRIALAHNRDDQIETVLMRIIKGTSIKGLRGIPSVRGPYVRPLIEVTRAEIEEYAKLRGVEFVEDSSNESTKYLRNKLRLDLIPLLEKDYNPAIKEALSSMSTSLKRDYAFIENEAALLFERAREDDKEDDGVEERLAFSRTKLIDADEALSTRVFLSAIEEVKGDTLDIYAVHVEAFLDLLTSDDPGASVDLPGGLRLRRVYDSVIFEAGARPARVNDYEVELGVPGNTPLKATGTSINAEILEGSVMKGEDRFVAFFDFDSIVELDGPLLIRSFRPGDRMSPLGLEGTKKLKDIFIDEKVARLKRGSVPLLVSNEEILWIAGLRRSERAKVRPNTKKTLRVEWLR